jgi:hypothetical protein
MESTPAALEPLEVPTDTVTSPAEPEADEPLPKAREPDEPAEEAPVCTDTRPLVREAPEDTVSSPEEPSTEEPVETVSMPLSAEEAPVPTDTLPERLPEDSDAPEDTSTTPDPAVAPSLLRTRTEPLWV